MGTSHIPPSHCIRHPPRPPLLASLPCLPSSLPLTLSPPFLPYRSSSRSLLQVRCPPSAFPSSSSSSPLLPRFADLSSSSFTPQLLLLFPSPDYRTFATQSYSELQCFLSTTPLLLSLQLSLLLLALTGIPRLALSSPTWPFSLPRQLLTLLNCLARAGPGGGAMPVLAAVLFPASFLSCDPVPPSLCLRFPASF